MNHGPVDVVILATTEPKFEGKVLAELERLHANDTINLLDALLLMKDDEGNGVEIDMEGLDDETKKALGFIETGTQGLFSQDDAATIFEGMVPGSVVVALAIENKWAVGLLNYMAEAGSEIAMHWRIPAPVVDEAFASLGK